MNTGSVNNLGLPVSLTQAVADGASGKNTGSSQTVGKDEFLQLLITQLKNQDPLDPIKNEAYIAQLATFSSLEQLIAIKEGVNTLAGIQADAVEDSSDYQTY